MILDLAGGAAVTVDFADLQACAHTLGIEEIPIVLGRGPPATGAVAGGMPPIPAGGRDGPVAAAVRTLSTAGAHVAARRVSSDGTARLCIAAREACDAPIVAERAPGDDAPVRIGPARGRGQELQRFLGASALARCPPVRVPLGPLRERLAGGSGDCAAAFTGCGVGAEAAQRAGRVLETATAWTEVVRVVRTRGTQRHTPAAMVIYESPYGRLAATPSAAPDGVLWVTIGPGDGGRIERGLAALDGLAPSA